MTELSASRVARRHLKADAGYDLWDDHLQPFLEKKLGRRPFSGADGDVDPNHTVSGDRIRLRNSVAPWYMERKVKNSAGTEFQGGNQWVLETEIRMDGNGNPMEGSGVVKGGAWFSHFPASGEDYIDEWEQLVGEYKPFKFKFTGGDLTPMAAAFKKATSYAENELKSWVPPEQMWRARWHAGDLADGKEHGLTRTEAEAFQAEHDGSIVSVVIEQEPL
jgi:hypothetical protein